RYEPLDLASDDPERPARRTRLERAENLLHAAIQTGHLRESAAIEPAGGVDSEEARLQRIEQMLSELMAARQDAVPAQPPVAQHPLAANEPAAPADPPRRYRLTGPVDSVRRHPLEDEGRHREPSESPPHPLEADRSGEAHNPPPFHRSEALHQWFPDTSEDHFPRHHPLHPLAER
ncbi:MAG: hypothetical protein ACREJB_02445, partial [Planctomycetaceae bacterium]